MNGDNLQDVDYTDAKQWNADDTNYYDIDLSVARENPEPIELAGQNIFVSLVAWDSEKIISSTKIVGSAVMTVNEKSGSPKELSAGMSYKTGAPFDKLWITNEAQAGAMMRIVVGVRTEVAPYSSVLEIPVDTRFDFSGIYLRTKELNSQSIMSTLRLGMDGGSATMSAGILDGRNVAYATVSNTATTIVSAAVNAGNGVIIRRCSLQAHSSQSASVKDGSGNVIEQIKNYGTVGFASRVEFENYFFPPDEDLILATSGTNSVVTIAYEVL